MRIFAPPWGRAAPVRTIHRKNDFETPDIPILLATLASPDICGTGDHENSTQTPMDHGANGGNHLIRTETESNYSSD